MLTQTLENKINRLKFMCTVPCWTYCKRWDYATNAGVLSRMSKKTEMLHTIYSRKLQYFGHILRHLDKYRLLQLVRNGKIENRRRPGRTSWPADMQKWFGCSKELQDCHGDLKTSNGDAIEKKKHTYPFLTKKKN